MCLGDKTSLNGILQHIIVIDQLSSENLNILK